MAKQKTSGFTKFIAVLFIGIGAFVFFNDDARTAFIDGNAAEAEKRRIKAAEQAKIDAKRDAEREAHNKEMGYHCAGRSNTPHFGVVNDVKSNLREPDSFEHVETKISSLKEDGTHDLQMTYRAKNGFGGVNVETVYASIKNSDCSFLVL